MAPSFRQLTVFRLLMKTQSVTETARLMRVSQPAVSQMLRSLEAGLGLELFIRLGGKIVPTDDARALINEVERIFVQLSAFGSRAEELRDGRAGHLSVVTIPTLTHFMVPKAVSALRKERPRLKIRIETSEQPVLVQMVKQEQADVGLSFAPIMDPGVAVEPIFTTRVVCCMLRDNPLSRQASVTLADLAAHPLIVLNRLTPPGMLLLENFEKLSLPELDRIEVNAGSTAIALVKERVGIALLDVMALFIANDPEIVAVPFEPEIPLVLTALYSRNRPVGRVTMRFIAQIKAVAALLGEDLKARGLPGAAV